MVGREDLRDRPLVERKVILRGRVALLGCSRQRGNPSPRPGFRTLGSRRRPYLYDVVSMTPLKSLAP